MSQKRTIGYHVLAVAIVGIWGMTFISTSVLLEYFSPAQIFTIRFLIAYIGMWFFAPRPFFSFSVKDELKLALAGVTGGSLYFLSENTALELSGEASSVSFIVCTTPLVTALLSIMLRHKGERMTWPLALGSACSLGGIALVMFNGSSFNGVPPAAYLLAMLASFTWAVYTIIISGLSDKYASAFISRKVFFYGLLTIIPFLLLQDRGLDMTAFTQSKVILNILFLSVVASLGCYALWTPVVRKLGTIKAGNYIYLNPLFTLAGAVVFLGEQMTWLSLGGSLLTLFGVWLASLTTKRHH